MIIGTTYVHEILLLMIKIRFSQINDIHYRIFIFIKFTQIYGLNYKSFIYDPHFGGLVMIRYMSNNIKIIHVNGSISPVSINYVLTYLQLNI